MKSIVLLEKCLLSEDVDGVLSFVNSFDPSAGNEKMAAFCAHFELPTVTVGGILYTHLSRASKQLGYSSESGLRWLMDAYQIQTPKIGWFAVELRTSIRDAFSLKPKDAQATLLSWGGVLVAGMSGKGDAAKRIRIYLYSMEVAASVALDERELGRAEKRKREEEAHLLALIREYRKESSADLKEIIREMIEARTGKELFVPKDAQLELVERED